MAASSQRGYWLVGTPASGLGVFKGSPAKVLFSDGPPAGYDYTHFLGDYNPKTQQRDLVTALAKALPSLPNGISVPSKLDVPGLGTTTIKGPGGIPGTLDKIATTTGNAISVTALFASANLWAGIGMTLLGVVLVLFGIVKLSGADPAQVAKRVMPL